MALPFVTLLTQVGSLGRLVLVVAALGAVILLHELGHYFAARFTRMRVEELSIGIGQPLFTRVRDGIRYSIRVFPFFGYVKIAGMNPLEEDAPDGFNSKSCGARALTLAAGGLANIAAAAVLFCALGMIYGEVVGQTSQIDRVFRDHPAFRAGIRSGDRIVGVDKTRTTNVEKIRRIIQEHPGKPLVVHVRRGTRTLSFSLVPRPESAEILDEHDKVRTKTIGIIGIVFHAQRRSIGMAASLEYGVKRTAFTVANVVYGLWLAVTGQEKLHPMGPVGIAVDLENQARLGLANLLDSLAMLNLVLGVLNLCIPFPALDGWRLLVLLVERIRGRSINRKIEFWVNAAGMSLLFTFLLVITIREVFDLLKHRFLG